MHRTVRRTISTSICMLLLMSGAACSKDKPKPPGPDVRGLVLTDAETALKKAHIGYSEHAKDALFGIVIKEHYIVCSEVKVNAHLVRLEVAKDGC